MTERIFVVFAQFDNTVRSRSARWPRCTATSGQPVPIAATLMRVLGVLGALLVIEPASESREIRCERWR